MTRNLWTRSQLIAVLKLYCVTPFGKIDQRNAEIRALAEQIGRTPSAVALKMTNFASLDPTLSQKGMVNASELDKEMWKDFFDNLDAFLVPEILPPDGETKGFSEDSDPALIWEWQKPTEKTAISKLRTSQDFFRRMILASYGNKCAMTGIEGDSMLVAGHILPWSSSIENRMNPHNGICLNALHDRAFEFGFLTISQDDEVVYSPKLSAFDRNVLGRMGTGKFHPPERFRPSDQFLAYHRENVFVK